MTTSARELGSDGEQVAADHLVQAGMIILDRNWRCPEGEIDIVARDGDVLVVCEVKTRRGVGFGAPLEAVTFRKAQRLRRLAAHWLREHDLRPRSIRIDLIGILWPTGGPVEIDHVRGAVG